MAANNYVKIVAPDGKIVQTLTLDDRDRDQIYRTNELSSRFCPPRGRIVAWKKVIGLNCDGVTGEVE